MEPREPPVGIVAHCTVGRLVRRIGIKLRRFFLAAEVFVYIRCGVLATVDIGTSRIFFNDQCKIVERLGVIVAVPENLCDLVERLGGFGTFRIFASDLLEQRHRLVPVPRRKIKSGEFG